MIIAGLFGVITDSQPLVFDHLARETGQDRSQSSESLRLCHLSDGGGGGSSRVIPSDLRADRTVVVAAAAWEDGMIVQHGGLATHPSKVNWEIPAYCVVSILSMQHI